MKAIRHIAFAVLITLGIFSIVTYASCSKDKCANVTCQNAGACTDGACVCPTGYEGKNCETLSRAKFIGTYTGNESCTANNNQYTLILAAGLDNLQLKLTNLNNNNISIFVTMSAPTIFTFADTVLGKAYSGNGSIYNNQVTIKYQVVDTSTSISNSCTFTGTK